MITLILSRKAYGDLGGDMIHHFVLECEIVVMLQAVIILVKLAV